MTRTNQQALDSALASRELQRTLENEPEIVVQQATPEQLIEAKAMIAKLRTWGLTYTIESDRSIDRKPCLCGCGNFPAGKKSVFCPGHDARYHAMLSGKAPKRTLKECACGCGGTTKSTWCPGHDATHAKAMRIAAAAAAKVA